MNKFMLVLSVAIFLVTTSLLLSMSSVGQAPVAMYLFIGGIGYCVSITVAIMASFVE